MLAQIPARAAPVTQRSCWSPSIPVHWAPALRWACWLPGNHHGDACQVSHPLPNTHRCQACSLGSQWQKHPGAAAVGGCTAPASLTLPITPAWLFLETMPCVSAAVTTPTRGAVGAPRVGCEYLLRASVTGIPCIFLLGRGAGSRAGKIRSVIHLAEGFRG